MNNQESSFTSAGALPVKLFMDDSALACIKNKCFLPIHIQLNPTNKCNQNCAFCSCGRRDKNKEIPLKEAISLIKAFHRLGAKAATITGGGEPTLYKDLGGLINFIYRKGIKAGLVTNGLRLDSVGKELGKITWCRISFSDSLKADKPALSRLLYFKTKFPTVDWSLSYVVTRDFNRGDLKKLIKFANGHGFSHIRIVSNLLDLSNVPDIGNWLGSLNDPGGKIIYQQRNDYTQGRNPCYLSLLKPNIGPDANMYPCCGTQYALTKANLDFPPSMSMGKDIENIYAKQKFFNGSKCKKCYYDRYNSLIVLAIKGLKHKEFI